MKIEENVTPTETSNELNISFADAGKYTVTNSDASFWSGLTVKNPVWTCEKHWETERTMTFWWDNKVQNTVCLECLIEKLGLPNIEDTRQ